MAVNLLGEFNLLIRVNRELTYSDLEDALVTAGFEDYTIVRQHTETGTDAQITVRNDAGTLDAQDTLTSLASAAASLDTGGGEGGS